MITLNSLKIITLAVVTVLSLNACKSTSSTQQTVESPVSITYGNARAEAYLNDVGRKIRMAIVDGEMTEEEGKLKYAATVQRVKKRMAGAKGSDAVGKRTFTKEDYDEASAKMARMVKAGEITREQMQQRLNRMKKAMGESADRGASDADKRARRARYQEAADKMAEMVKAGEITREQMEARLNRMKKAMDGESRKITKEDYYQAVAKMTEMVNAGEITCEQMLQRLERMSKAIVYDSSAEQPKKVTREDFAEAVTEMTKMVEAGKITREEMRERLSAMRRAIGEYNQGQNRKEISDDCIALRKKLGEAVRSGEMTREEAGKIWDEEGC